MPRIGMGVMVPMVCAAAEVHADAHSPGPCSDQRLCGCPWPVPSQETMLRSLVHAVARHYKEVHYLLLLTVEGRKGSSAVILMLQTHG